MIRAAPILALGVGLAAAAFAGEVEPPVEGAVAPLPPTEACSVCDLRQEAKRRLAAARQAAQADKDAPIIALPPAPKGD